MWREYTPPLACVTETKKFITQLQGQATRIAVRQPISPEKRPLIEEFLRRLREGRVRKANSPSCIVASLHRWLARRPEGACALANRGRSACTAFPRSTSHAGDASRHRRQSGVDSCRPTAGGRLADDCRTPLTRRSSSKRWSRPPHTTCNALQQHSQQAPR